MVEGLLGRLGANASRQAVGALLFFLTTVTLSASLGAEAYASYFGAWNLAQIVVTLTGFGLYNDTIRRFVEGQSGRQVLRAQAVPYGLQALAIGASGVAVQWVSGQNALLVALIALSVAVSNALTAVALGKDWFWRFASGELVQNAALYALVWLIQPRSTDVVGYLFVGSALAKGALYLLSPARNGEAAAARKPPRTAGPRAYAAMTYGHSLLQIATYRGAYLLAERLAGPGAMAALAVAWSFCDRALLLVQGVNQVMLPKLMAGTVSDAFIRKCTLGCISAFLLAAAGMGMTWHLLGRLEVVTMRPVAWWTMLLLPLAFVPLVLRQLRMTVLLSRQAFGHLFASHSLACLALLACALPVALLHWQSPAVAGTMLVAMSLAALPPLYWRDKR